MYHSPARVRPRQRGWLDVGCVPTAAPKGLEGWARKSGLRGAPTAGTRRRAKQRGRAGGPKGRTPAAIVQPHLRVIQLQVRRQASGEGTGCRDHTPRVRLGSVSISTQAGDDGKGKAKTTVVFTFTY
jgi:hypothetical protein